MVAKYQVLYTVFLKKYGYAGSINGLIRHGLDMVVDILGEKSRDEIRIRTSVPEHKHASFFGDTSGFPLTQATASALIDSSVWISLVPCLNPTGRDLESY